MIADAIPHSSLPPSPTCSNGLKAFDKEKWSFSSRTSGYNVKILQGKKGIYKSLYKIAIIAPARTPLILDIQRMFTDTLRSSSFLDHQFTIYNAHGNYDKLHVIINEIINDKFDLIYTIGTTATQIAKERTEAAHYPIPVVFSNVHKPTQRKFIQNEQCSGNNLTGIKCDDILGYEKQVDLLLRTQKIKTLTLLYGEQYGSTRSDFNETALNSLKKKYAPKSIEIIGINSTELNGNFEKLTDSIARSDIFMPLRNLWADSLVSEIASLCNRYRTIFFPSALSSLKKGAAIAYGPAPEGIAGKAAAYKVMGIFEEQKAPMEVPISPANYSYQLKVNPETMHLQGLNMTRQLHELVEWSEMP